jgi:hypothetical protein
MKNPMSHSPLRLFVLCLWVGVCTTNVTPQQDDTIRRRAMFVNKRADGLEIKILKLNGGVEETVSPSQEFRAGDELRLAFRSNFDGHVYFVNVAPNSDTNVIYHSQVKADQENTLPGGRDSIQFNNEVGVEVLKIVLSREAIPVFDEARKSANGYLGKTSESVAKELTRSLPSPADKKTENVGIVQPNNDPGARCRGLKLAIGDKFRCRGLVLASGSAKSNQGTVAIAMSEETKEKADDGRLKAGDVIVIDLHLKHVQ